MCRNRASASVKPLVRALATCSEPVFFSRCRNIFEVGGDDRMVRRGDFAAASTGRHNFEARRPACSNRGHRNSANPATATRVGIPRATATAKPHAADRSKCRPPSCSAHSVQPMYAGPDCEHPSPRCRPEAGDVHNPGDGRLLCSIPHLRSARRRPESGPAPRPWDRDETGEHCGEQHTPRIRPSARTLGASAPSRTLRLRRLGRRLGRLSRCGVWWSIGPGRGAARDARCCCGICCGSHCTGLRDSLCRWRRCRRPIRRCGSRCSGAAVHRCAALHAAAVAYRDGEVLGGAGKSAAASEPQDFSAGVEQCACDAGVG